MLRESERRMDAAQPGQLEIHFGGEIVPFPSGQGVPKRRRRACPCRCVLEKTAVLRRALEYLSAEELDQLASRLAFLRARSAARS